VRKTVNRPKALPRRQINALTKPGNVAKFPGSRAAKRTAEIAQNLL
jgi:hypothetical protein